MIMKKAVMASIFYIVFLFITPSNTLVFAGERKGLIGGFSFGLGMTSWELGKDMESYHLTRGNIAYDGRLGFAPSNQLQYYVILKGAFLFKSPTSDFWKATWFLLFPFYLVYHSHALIGIGLNYYLNQNAPSLFFQGGFGASGCHFTYNKNFENIGGALGLFVGVGYEYRKHKSIELQLMWSHKPEKTVDIKDYYDALTLTLSLNFLSY